MGVARYPVGYQVADDGLGAQVSCHARWPIPASTSPRAGRHGSRLRGRAPLDGRAPHAQSVRIVRTSFAGSLTGRQATSSTATRPSPGPRSARRSRSSRSEVPSKVLQRLVAAMGLPGGPGKPDRVTFRVTVDESSSRKKPQPVGTSNESETLDLAGWTGLENAARGAAGASRRAIWRSFRALAAGLVGPGVAGESQHGSDL